MNKANLETSIVEAKRFLKKALELHKKQIDPEMDSIYRGSPEASSIKRASMDLTRSLAQLRKPL